MTHEPSNPTAALPVAAFRDAIVASVDDNQVTIITAETGAGKSTQIPQYLAEAGYDKVIVTQPRILAARNLAARVRHEWGERNHEPDDTVVGYRTAHERDDAPGTRILYCTDGLQLVREITGAGTRARQVLVLDEVHEWNENMEVLVAWAKKRCASDPGFKVVIMSATIETIGLSDFFGTTAIIAVPGRSFPVAISRGTDIVSEIMGKIGTGANVLVFLPGKAEIQEVGEAIAAKAKAAGVPVIPLHSQMEAEMQQRAFAHHDTGKVILSTNIAQTSVTIDDIDVVIDSGLERRSEVRNGVEGLFIAQVSQADCRQRAGRAGRTKPGEYILAPLGPLQCLKLEDRDDYGTPEIMRKHVDRLTLRLASVGIDIEELDFYHDPGGRAIRRAKTTLQALGALTPSNEVTAIGAQMERFPVESSYGRMLVEAGQYDAAVVGKLAAIIAIQEVGGIVKGGPRYTGWRTYTKQTQSDLLAQYDVYLAEPMILPEAYDELGIIEKNIGKAAETFERLTADLGLGTPDLTPVSSEEQDLLCRCIVAGQIDQLWVIDGFGTATHLQTRTQRELSSSTVVAHPRLVAGTPFDLQITTRSGALEILQLVQEVTNVKAEWLTDLAPGVFTVRSGRIAFDPVTGKLATRQTVRYGKQTFDIDGGVLPHEARIDRALYAQRFAEWAYQEIEQERRNLIAKGARHVPGVPLKRLQTMAKAVTYNIHSLDDVRPGERLQLLNLARLETHLGSALMKQLTNRSHRGESRNHGWRPKHKRRPDR